MIKKVHCIRRRWDDSSRLAIPFCSKMTRPPSVDSWIFELLKEQYKCKKCLKLFKKQAFYDRFICVYSKHRKSDP